MIETTKYARKPFYVDAVQVTADNMEEVARWCMGDIRTTDEGGTEEQYVKVRVHRPLTERQTQAKVTDWVLYAGTGFKVYTDRAFQKSFEKVTTLSKAQADEAGIHPPIENPKPVVPSPAQVMAGRGRAATPEVDYRDAGSGQFVTEEYAEKNPGTTVAEAEPEEEPDPAAEAEQILAEIEQEDK